jgi:RND family efflux transporter MFP subunit
MAELEAELRQARLDLERTQGLAQRDMASQADLDRDRLAIDVLEARLDRTRQDITVAERTVAVQQQMVEDMKIHAPFSGVVIAKAAQPGEIISPVSAGGGFTRTGICTLVDMGSLEVEVDVNESYINRVQPGQAVTVTLNAYPDDSMPAEVIAIIPAADRTKATVRVRVELVAPNDQVLPDMGVKVAFLEARKAPEPVATPAGVLVPQDAIGRDAAGEFVWVVRDGAARKRPVTVAGRQGNRALVTQGLGDGERVVTGLADELLASLAEGTRLDVLN